MFTETESNVRLLKQKQRKDSIAGHRFIWKISHFLSSVVEKGPGRETACQDTGPYCNSEGYIWNDAMNWLKMSNLTLCFTMKHFKRVRRQNYFLAQKKAHFCNLKTVSYPRLFSKDRASSVVLKKIMFFLASEGK